MTLQRMKRLAMASVLAGSAHLVCEGTAFAQQSAADKTAAETLFVSARKLLQEGKYAEACRALAESQRLDPGVGTLLNLGRCYEKMGRTASAWSTYREAAAAARAASQPAREKNARIAAEALEKKLPMLTISVARPESTPNLEVHRDGAIVPSGVWGMAVAIDPGEHVFEASAPGRKTWHTEAVAQPGKQLTISVPVLEVDEKTAPSPSASSSRSSTTNGATAGPVVVREPPKEPPHEKSSFGAHKVASILVGAAGIGALGVGGYYGLRAKSIYNAADCVGTECSIAGQGDRNMAYAKARNSTILVAGGLVAIAGAVVLWVTAPSGPSDSPTASAPPPRLWVSADIGAQGERSFTLSGAF